MILIDTGPLVALCDRRDSKHRTAVGHLEGLASQTLVTCDAVLTEACFHLASTPQRRRLGALLDRLEVSALSYMGERGWWPAVLAWMDKYADHEPDLADACLAVLAGRDRALQVWTYDREFRTTWRRPDGTRIPLAV